MIDNLTTFHAHGFGHEHGHGQGVKAERFLEAVHQERCHR